MAATDWMADAACMDHKVLDWFDDEHFQEAAKVCDTCEARKPCLEYAVTHNIADGVWGGLVPHQLRQAIKARGRSRRQPLAGLGVSGRGRG